MNKTDLNIWENFIAGDDKAYTYIYDKYAQTLFAYGLRFTSDRELVKDAIHDMFLKLYINRNSLGTTTNIKFYLFVALKNTLLNIFRKEASFCAIDTITDSLSDTDTDPYSYNQLLLREEEVEKKKEVTRILNILSPRQKEAMYYRFIEGLSFEEIEVLMKINYQSIQNLIHSSLKKIKEDLLNKESDKQNQPKA